MQHLGKIARAALQLLAVGLVIPGGSLVLLVALLKGGVVADLLPAKFAAFLPSLKAFRIR